jgi:ferricrocin synthase
VTLITRCHEFNMKMQDFQHTPLKEIQKWSPAKSGQLLFDTLFVFQRPESEDDFAEGIWSQIEDEPVADVSLQCKAMCSVTYTYLVSISF